MSDAAPETNSMPDRVHLDPDYHGWTNQVVGWADGNEAQGIDEWPLYVRADLTTPDTRDALIKELVGALDEIANIKERKKDCYPPDWRKQIAACPECQRYKGHPIQQGICDEHRKPIYAQEDHDRHETKILGYRSMDIARVALTRAKEAGYGAE